jgi:hypothetical protein
MRRSPRWRISCLALLYGIANFGLPSADLILHHRLGEGEAAPEVHLELPGGCHSHAEHCVLDRVLSDCRLQLPAPAVECQQSSRWVALRLTHAVRSPSTRDLALPLSRGPPLSSDRTGSLAPVI